MRALITGINGFVGEYLSAYLLTKNIEVYGTYLKGSKTTDIHEDISIYELDITSSEQVNEVILNIKPDWIFHLAAQSSAAVSWKQPQQTMNINICGTINILESIKENSIDTRILLIGSSEEYGHVRIQDIPVKETHDLCPANPYAISKIAQTMIGELYSKSYNMDIVMVRAFNHIGPKQLPIFVVSDFAKRIAQIEAGDIKPVLKVGNLDAVRDFTDVRDIVRAYYLLMNSGKKGEQYNVGSGNRIAIKEILQMLLNNSKKEITIELDPDRMRPSDSPIISADNKKLINDTGWKPELCIEKTIQDTLEYWRQKVCED